MEQGEVVRLRFCFEFESESESGLLDLWTGGLGDWWTGGKRDVTRGWRILQGVGGLREATYVLA